MKRLGLTHASRRRRGHAFLWLLLLSVGTCGAGFCSRVGAAQVPEARTSGTYVLQRGDSIDIKVFNLPELSETVTIRPDGRISVLLLDDVEAAGLTTSHLDQIITARYTNFYREPQVTIIVKTFANQKVYVGGEVMTPGVVQLAGDLTAMRAVLQAGGLKATARAEEVLLLRDSGAGAPRMTRLNLKDIVHKGQPDYPLHPFDVVYVPRTKIAKVNEFMNQYVKQLIPITLSAGFSYLLNNPLTDSSTNR